MNDAPEQLPLLNEPRANTVFVADTGVLESAIASLQNAPGRLAIDAERASGFKYSQRAYLVQLKKESTPVYLVDPIAFTLSELAPLAAAINSDEWILHAATQDLACLAELGLHPLKIFDTELISRLLGFERVGLGAVCERVLSLRLAKEHSAADWSTRPLPDSWLNYAALDVDVLNEIADALAGLVSEQGKEDIVNQEMDHLLGFKPKPQKQDKWRTIGGFHELKEPRQLAIAKSLWESREELAKKLDVSPGRLLPDSSILHCAKTGHRTRPQLAADKGFNGRASRSYLDLWWGAVEAAHSARDLPPMRISSPGIPNHRSWPAKFPEAQKRLDTAKAVIVEVSTRLSIPAENVITPDVIRAFCFEPIGITEAAIADQLSDLGARHWQVAELAAPISLRLGKQSQDPS